VTIIFTTRSGRKSTATLSALVTHLSTLDGQGHHDATLRIRFSTAQVDLTDLRSVVALSAHLNSKFPKLDAVIFNAGMGAFLGIDWLNAFKSMAINWVEAMTHPTFKIQAVGRVAKQQGGHGEDIGEVFCANVFGHYYLAHEIVPLLRKGAGRVIWISSLEAYAWTYDTQDLEGRSASHSYESSKRLTDVMALTSNSNATKPWADKFFQEEGEQRKVTMFTCHPGICATSMVDLPLVLWYCMTLAFYIARWLGSPWHTISSHSGANSAVHLALAKDEELTETKAERIKWGSGCDRTGREVLMVTEVEGKGGEEWEQMGRETWKQMEELRVSWKARLEG
jgi:3-keto steroid reductase